MCLITRDEPLLGEALRSVRAQVDELIVVVTSGKDADGISTARAIADYVEVFTNCNDETGEIADFSVARNYAFSLASFDWKLWMDADDIVDLARLPEVLEFYQHLRKATGRDVLVSFPYEYSVDGQGVCNLVVPRERLVCGALARWVGEIHETIPTPPWGQPPSGSAENPDTRLVWKHQRYKSDAKRAAMGLPASNGPKRNIRICRRAYERTGDLRMLFYLGTALCDAGDFEGVTRLEEYVGKTLVEDEKMMALLHLVKATIAKGLFDDAIRWGLQAVACKEKWSEGYLALGRVYHQRGFVTKDRRDWEKCVHFTEIGLSVPPTKTFLFFDPTERSYWAHERMNYARAMIGDTRGALESARQGLAAKPEDTNLQLNVLVYEEQLARADAKAAVGKMKTAALELARRFEFPRASEDAYGRVETMIEDPRQADALVNLGGRGGQRPGEDGQDGQGVSGGKGGKCGAGEPQRSGLDIVFALGDCWEVWTPDTADRTGIGGSETAVIEMAKRLAAKGHRVRVFTSTVPGTYDGVEYLPSVQLGNAGLGCDIFIAWRNAWLLDSPIQARVKLLWVHDVFAVGATRENLARVDKVLALSAWHRNFLAQYHAQHGLTLDKIFQTRNGVDLYKFDVYQGDNAVARNPFKCVYSSSADRGLEQLLEMWPRIRAEVPLATLDIFYGFSNWEKMAQNDRESLTRINRLKGAINALSGAGVVLRGRVNQLTLAKEFLSAGVWLYPTAFTETSCLTAMEAQEAGLRIVTTPLAALVETVGPRGVMIDGDNTTGAYQDAFVRAAVAVLRVPEEELVKSPMAHLGREVLQKYARANFSWDGVVEQWERELFPKVEEVAGGLDPVAAQLLGVARRLVEPAPLRWSPENRSNLSPSSDPKPSTAPAKPKIRIDVVLSETASGGQPIDPENYLAVSHGGGSGRGCLGLVHALRKRGDYEVRAFAKFSRAVPGFYPLEKYDRLATDRDVVFAFYDTSPLRDVEHGLRIASHHTYVPPDIWFSSFTDVNTAPTAHAVGRLRDGFNPHGNWEILPNGVHNLGAIWIPRPGRVVHHVSPDRGAHLLLHSWPAIRREVPEATLHMIGDVQGTAWNNSMLRPAFARTVVGKRIKALQDGMREAVVAGGVTFLGHVPREALIRELSEASCFAYPCSVSMPCETFSVSTMECLMAGVPVVLSPADALGFYGDAVEMVREPAEEHMSEFVEAVVRVLRSTDLQQHLSMKGKKFAEGFTHDNMATALDRIVRKYL
jgi:glycosyltransferase involved in cell wall biosynthesis